MTFGVIVLNGEPFTGYCLRALYRFAHQIIVVEGACYGAASNATADGHSTDGTFETLRRFKAEEDPDDKLVIVTAEDEGYANGFWPGEKDEQSKAYAKRATGDYLWQVDIDEFYNAEDMQRVIDMLRNDSEITAVTFRQIAYWGSPEYIVDSWYLRSGKDAYHRLFKWGEGYEYVTHRPPTVCDDRGRDLRSVRWIDSDQMAKRGVYLHHYSLLFPKQVEEKTRYYATGPAGEGDGEYAAGAIKWAYENYLGAVSRPFKLHNVHTHPGWLTRYKGSHPCEVARMWSDIRAGRVSESIRDNSDVENLLSKPLYRFGRMMLCLIPRRVLRNRFSLWRFRQGFRHVGCDTCDQHIDVPSFWRCFIKWQGC